MSSMPECKGCGKYIHGGPCYCEDCANKKDSIIEQMKEALEEAEQYLDHHHTCNIGKPSLEYGNIVVRECDCGLREYLDKREQTLKLLEE